MPISAGKYSSSRPNSRIGISDEEEEEEEEEEEGDVAVVEVVVAVLFVLRLEVVMDEVLRII